MEKLFKELYDALESVALNIERRDFSDVELDEALELATLMVDGLNVMRKRKVDEYEREDEVQAPEA